MIDSGNEEIDSGNSQQQDLELQEELKEKQPLLRALIAKADREGHTLQYLAESLGVTYARLAQWRRGESHIANAQRSVHEYAARYLGIPVILVLVMAERITLTDLFWPSQDNLELKVATEIRKLFKDPFLGAFIPQELSHAPNSVQLFVLFLYRELNASGTGRSEPGSASWLRVVRDAIIDEDIVRAVASS